MRPEELKSVEQEAEDRDRAQKRIGAFLGFCPECIEAYQHAPSCSLRDSVKLSPPPAPITRHYVRALAGHRRVHIRKSDRREWECGVTGSDEIVSSTTEVTCRLCRRAAGLPYLPKKNRRR